MIYYIIYYRCIYNIYTKLPFNFHLALHLQTGKVLIRTFKTNEEAYLEHTASQCKTFTSFKASILSINLALILKQKNKLRSFYQVLSSLSHLLSLLVTMLVQDFFTRLALNPLLALHRFYTHPNIPLILPSNSPKSIMFLMLQNLQQHQPSIHRVPYPRIQQFLNQKYWKKLIVILNIHTDFTLVIIF